MSILIIILILLLINAAGYIFRIYELDNYLVLIGFRFHLSLILPILFLLNKRYRTIAADKLTRPGKFNLSILMLIFFAGIILFAALFITEIIKLTDPDYFYELGISSIIDFPVYLIWNLPHIIIFTTFISVISTDRKAGYLIAFLVFAFSFAYQLIPIEKQKFDIIAAAQLLSASLLFSIIVYKTRNIYLSSCLIFLSVWLFLLLSGSQSKEMVSIFLGKYYSSWEGFFIAGKEWREYMFFFYSGIQLIFIMVYILINAYTNKSVKNTAS